ncbi:MAG: glutamate synthase (NADPH), homotetrameric [Epulopiscium sp. Nuni2H_MBin003]|nr:MAG: glutamate synthase (NADPH), homotetrameric [Epulopiscium sp. Nuni2H_MBin003]
MPNMSNVKVPMPEQKPNIRNANFEEVSLGYTDDMAVEEAERCLNCKHKPCIKGCPVNVQIPEFIMAIKEREFKKANDIIKETSSLPAVCGRVCPQEVQCEGLCVRGRKGEPVGIGRLERFAADWAMQNVNEKPAKPTCNGKKVAIVGAGPASLTCAGDLALMGYDVTLFEAFHVAGGVLMYGIPEFRLPKAIVQKEINTLKELGVKIITNYVVGKSATIDDLFEEGYLAVFVGSGAGLPRFMNLPGENLNGVYSANEYLTRINLMKAYEDGAVTPIYKAKNVAVFGGGNVAMDAARSAKRMGAENVYIVYRRSENELPARLEEIHHAKEEGIEFKILSNPNEIIGDDNFWVKAIKCDTMELGEPDESGRRSPVKVPNAEFILEVDCVIVSIGTSPNPIIPSSTPDLTTNRWGCVVADDAGVTEKPGVFAGGDVVTGAATVILAMGAGKNAAVAMDTYIKGL